jgi:putative chitinase
MMLEFLQAYYPRADKRLLATLATAYPAAKTKYNVNAVMLAHALGQVKHESGGLTTLTENLNYSAQRLQEVFRLDAATAARIARKPKDIAEYVYGTGKRARLLGNTSPEDGWAFRGRGPIQLTGRWIYAQMQSKTGTLFLQQPELALDPAYFWDVIFGFFVVKGALLKLQAPINAANIEAVSRVVNGGTNGLAERIEFTMDAAKKLSMFHAA